MPDSDAPEPIDIEAQVTPAHVLQALAEFREEIKQRLDRDRIEDDRRFDKIETTIKDSGLNGHTPYLKALLEQYAATYASRQAWITVKGDIAHRFRWLSSPRAWLRFLAAAAVGGAFTGWAANSGIHIHGIPGI